jgi:hypothetical protein
MRMPWQRRSGWRAEVDSTPAPESTRRNDWTALPPLQGSIGGRPPLTARSAEFADALSRRLRSTRERPPLLHRAGLPERAAAGTVRGLATAAHQSNRAASARQSQRQDEDGFVAVVEKPPDSGTSPQLIPRVSARRAATGSLTAVGSALAALLHAPQEPRRDSRVDDGEVRVDDEGAAPAQLAEPRPGQQRTVIRRRAGSPRPLGLQAPLGQPDADAPGPRPAAEDRSERSTQLAHSEKPPRTVAAAVGRLHRADVDDVQIVRGKDADRLAATEHARAVTRGGEVFIPASAGRLDTGRGAGLLAHELTHVIQQRRLGNSVPLEHSPAGRRLESEAAMTERHVRGDAGAPPPPQAASQPSTQQPVPTQPPAPAPPAHGDDDEAAKSTVQDIQEQLIASGRAVRMPDGSLVFPGSGAHLPHQRQSPTQPAIAMQRAPEDPAPVSAPEPGSSEPSYAPRSGMGSVPPADATPPSSAPRAAGSVPPADAPAPSSALPAVFDIASTSGTSRQPEFGDAPAPAAPAATPSASATEAAPEPAASLDIDDLARRVYGQVRTQLRSELLIDRERAGLLTDFR